MAKAPQVPMDGIAPSAIAHLVGNGMHVVSAGAVVLLAALFVQKK